MGVRLGWNGIDRTQVRGPESQKWGGTFRKMNWEQVKGKHLMSVDSSVQLLGGGEQV